MVRDMDSVVINAFSARTGLLQSPAGVNYITKGALARTNGTGVLQAINNTPGVVMEERSPGSYRLNVRGSSVRSPYGVRNVRIYYNDIPFTAPGGSSMLNILGQQNFGNIEVIKGMGNSMYGAGTGGVMLIHSPQPSKNYLIETGVLGGSYGLAAGNLKVNAEKHLFTYEHLQGKGYREQSAINRQNFSWYGNLQSSQKNTLSATALLAHLKYETPGALTQREFDANKRSSRPATATLPGAKDVDARIAIQAAFVGLSNQLKINERLNNQTSVYAFFNKTISSAIQNFEESAEPHVGARTQFEWKLNKAGTQHNFLMGGEYQHGFFWSRVSAPNKGEAGEMRFKDDIKVSEASAFVAWNAVLQKWVINAGAAVHFMNLNFHRNAVVSEISSGKKFEPSFNPRLAILYKVKNDLSVYTDFATGFAPPSIDEIFADNNIYNLSLSPEKGNSTEAGIRGYLFTKSVWFDLNMFHHRLKNSLVTRRDSSGGNYFVNAGSAIKKGAELLISTQVLKNISGFRNGIELRASYGFSHFRYKDFVQANADFSGKEMPGVSPNTFSLQADASLTNGLGFYFTYNYSDRIFLNDANSVAAKAWQVLNFKTDYSKTFAKTKWNFFAGVDNVFNKTYSLGNDINGFGGRYFNVAPGRSVYAGLNLSFIKKNERL